MNCDEMKLRFEESLMSLPPVDEPRGIIDYEFLADRLACIPLFRPFLLNRVIGICHEYCKIYEFNRALLRNSLVLSPVIAHRLFKMGDFSIDDIIKDIEANISGLKLFYFRKYHQRIEDIIQETILKGFSFEYDFLGNISNIDLMIEYGFCPTSIEYCLKYDQIDDLQELLSGISTLSEYQAQWNPFEWSLRPRCLDLLSFSGYFGSIKCFRVLLMKGYCLNSDVFDSVVCCGSSDLIQMCLSPLYDLKDYIFSASKYCHLSLLKFCIEQRVDVNSYEFSVY